MRAHAFGCFLVLSVLVPSAPARGVDPFSDAAILAANSVHLRQGSSVTGDVVVTAASAGATLAGADLLVDRLVTITGDARADRVVLKSASTVDGDVFTNALDDQGAVVTGAVSPYSPSFLPVFRDAAVRSGAADVFVAAGQTVTLAAGAYRDVTIAQTGVLVLAGGVYDLRSITAGSASAVRFAAPAELRIAGRFALGKSSYVGPQTGSGVGAADIVLYVGGGNGGDGSPLAQPSAATVGQSSVVQANVYAPNGTLWLDRNTHATGAFIGRDVRIDAGGVIAVASSFTNRAPIADPRTVFTSGGDPIVVTLTGSDPEQADLTFSIEVSPAQGTLTNLTPIVPAPVPEIDRATGLPTGDFVQPPVTSATVTYKPNTANDVEDGFTFTVRDPCDAAGMAVVDVNPFDTSPPPSPLTFVVADDLSIDTTTNTAARMRLSAGAPPSVAALTFAIETLPGSGTLTDAAANAIESVPYDLPSPVVFYTPGTDFTGNDGFAYSARESGATSPPCTSPSCDTATVSINVSEPFELAEDQEVTTNLNQPVQVTLTANPGGTGTTSPQLLLGPAKRVKAFPGAAVAGNVSDADGDGFGDGRDNLPGPAPVLIAAGVDVNLGPPTSGIQGVARIQVEWDVSSVNPTGEGITSATVTLKTQKGTVDDLDTSFFVGAADQDGSLAVSDFQAPATAIPGAVMPVPAGPTGTEGTFSFNVTKQLQAALDQGFDFFSIQGRVEEDLAGGGFRRGLQVRSTATGNLALGKEPQLAVVVTPAPPFSLTFRIETLPSFGTLRTSTGSPVTVGQTFTNTTSLTYTPNFNFSGNDSLVYKVTEGLKVDLATIIVVVGLDDGCAAVGRPPGCAPGGN